LSTPWAVMWGILIPFIGTSAGAISVLMMKKEPKPSLQNFLLGFSAGVMIAASVWSLLLPSIEMSEQFGRFAWLPAAVGFLFGIFFLLFLDNVIPHLHLDQQFPEGPRLICTLRHLELSSKVCTCQRRKPEHCRNSPSS